MTQVQENTVLEQPQEAAVQDNTEELEILETPEIVEEEQPEAQQQKPFDPKTDRVDFSTPEQEAKFNYVYKQVKMSDARNQMLTEMLQTQQGQLDELKTRFSNTDSADAERVLLTKIKTARDSGDDAAEIAAFNELVDFKADKKLNAFRQPSPPPQQNQETNYISGLMQETDDAGQPLRPWLQEGHPEFMTAVNLLETKISPKFKGDPLFLQKSMYELDQVMRSKMTEQPPKTQPQLRAPNPMQGSNLTNTKQKTTIKMTRQELDIAKKLGVDPKRYAAKREEINGRK